jgi:hypothetical protein
MICQFCGVEIHNAAGHDTQQACIAALRTEIASLRNVLKHTMRPDEPLIPPEQRAAALSRLRD